MCLNHCKILTYSQLLSMKRKADHIHDFYWEWGMFGAAYRYTKIAQRILEAMARLPIENVLK